jgi:hypothetical protein
MILTHLFLSSDLLSEVYKYISISLAIDKHKSGCITAPRLLNNQLKLIFKPKPMYEKTNNYLCFDDAKV